jgi:hypothetical protein
MTTLGRLTLVFSALVKRIDDDGDWTISSEFQNEASALFERQTPNRSMVSPILLFLFILCFHGIGTLGRKENDQLFENRAEDFFGVCVLRALCVPDTVEVGDGVIFLR